MTAADTTIELTQVVWNVKAGGIDNKREVRRIQQLERLEPFEPHPIAAKRLGARRARFALPPFIDQAGQRRHCQPDALPLSACVVAIPRPVAERTAA